MEFFITSNGIILSLCWFILFKLYLFISKKYKYKTLNFIFLILISYLLVKLTEQVENKFKIPLSILFISLFIIEMIYKKVISKYKNKSSII
jgi:hypothetical protein